MPCVMSEISAPNLQLFESRDLQSQMKLHTCTGGRGVFLSAVWWHELDAHLVLGCGRVQVICVAPWCDIHVSLNFYIACRSYSSVEGIHVSATWTT